MFKTYKAGLMQAMAKLSDAEKWLRCAINDGDKSRIAEWTAKVESAKQALRAAR